MPTDTPTIEIRPDWYYVGLWYADLVPWVSAGPKGGNFLAVLYQEDGVPKERWEVKYRFRYFHDDKVHDSQDQRSWYGFTTSCTLEQAKEACDKVVAGGVDSGGFRCPQFIPIYGMGMKALEVMKAHPCFSARQEKEVTP